MAGHRITPYELTATRRYAHKDEDKDAKLLLSAQIVREGSEDILDALKQNLTSVDPFVAADKSRTVRCVDVKREGNVVDAVFACDVHGEREVVRDVERGVVVFMKGPEHVARYYSCVRVWRPASGDTGLLLVHSPWGRGGSKNQILTLMQRAVNEVEGSAAKLHADPKIPEKILERLLANAQATRIAYTKNKSIRSRFANASSDNSAQAEMVLVVKGSESRSYRDALKAALRSGGNRQRFFTVKMRNPSTDKFENETFDDVEVSIDAGGRTTTYSVAQDTVPTMGFDYTEDMTKVYLGLPKDGDGRWPTLLREGATTFMDRVLHSVRQS